ncbi:hypothetical protein [Actinomadura montaniterrae]|uniref:Uncharacterized protein n=1 Tax=Actinomadura montaniterrae TaxID=1803903 RepID=A0A6L3VYE5_9ACTN|nr:hypothetical protein [Actinomadura montaniterrae]KAB2385960.1 hypothetical protein F9B16_09190 [Actinomadura montaniterrae]
METRAARGMQAPEAKCDQGELLAGGIEQRLVIGAWRVTMHWPAPIAGGPRELTIRPDPEASPESLEHGIAAGVLRAIPLPRITREVMAMFRSMERTSEEGPSFEKIERMIGRISNAAESNPRPGRAGRSLEFFARVAAVYSWYVDRGYPDPVRKLAQSCGCKWRIAANWVRLARKKGLLTSVPSGRPGGMLTDEAKLVLGPEYHRSHEVISGDNRSS